MKTTTTLLTLAALMGIAGQVTAVETQPFYGYGTESYTTGGATTPATNLVGTEGTGAPLPDIWNQDPSKAFSTTTPATNLVGTQRTGNVPVDLTESTVELTEQTTDLQQPTTDLINQDALIQQDESTKQSIKDTIASALDMTNLDAFTKTALQIKINTQIDATWKDVTNAFNNVANQISDKVIAFKNAPADTAAEAGNRLQIAIKDALTTNYNQNQTNISENDKAALAEAATTLGQNMLDTIQLQTINELATNVGNTVTAN